MTTKNCPGTCSLFCKDVGKRLENEITKRATIFSRSWCLISASFRISHRRCSPHLLNHFIDKTSDLRTEKHVHRPTLMGQTKENQTKTDQQKKRRASVESPKHLVGSVILVLVLPLPNLISCLSLLSTPTNPNSQNLCFSSPLYFLPIALFNLEISTNPNRQSLCWVTQSSTIVQSSSVCSRTIKALIHVKSSPTRVALFNCQQLTNTPLHALAFLFLSLCQNHRECLDRKRRDFLVKQKRERERERGGGEREGGRERERNNFMKMTGSTQLQSKWWTDWKEEECPKRRDISSELKYRSTVLCNAHKKNWKRKTRVARDKLSELG